MGSSWVRAFYGSPYGGGFPQDAQAVEGSGVLGERFVVSDDQQGFSGSYPLGWIEDTGPYMVARVHYVGFDSEATRYLMEVAVYREIFPGSLDAWDGFVRRVGSEVRLERHFRDGHREFWDKMNAALGEFGVVRLPWGLEPLGAWHEDDKRGFYTYVKEVE